MGRAVGRRAHVVIAAATSKLGSRRTDPSHQSRRDDLRAATTADVRQPPSSVTVDWTLINAANQLW
jgi:hypothetical protein